MILLLPYSIYKEKSIPEGERSLKDIEDMFGEFSQETGLSILGSLSYNPFDEKLYFLVKVDKPSPLALRSSVLQ